MDYQGSLENQRFKMILMFLTPRTDRHEVRNSHPDRCLVRRERPGCGVCNMSCLVSLAKTESLITQTKITLTFFKSMNISTVNVTFETISFLYFFNFTDEEFFNLSSQDFQNFQPNLTELGKFGFIITRLKSTLLGSFFYFLMKIYF